MFHINSPPEQFLLNHSWPPCLCFRSCGEFRRSIQGWGQLEETRDGRTQQDHAGHKILVLCKEVESRQWKHSVKCATPPWIISAYISVIKSFCRVVLCIKTGVTVFGRTLLLIPPFCQQALYMLCWAHVVLMSSWDMENVLEDVSDAPVVHLFSALLNCGLPKITISGINLCYCH